MTDWTATDLAAIDIDAISKVSAMPDILIVTFDARGNVPPALGIGKELLRRGNRVRVLGHEAQRKTVDAAGLDFHASGHSPRWTATEDTNSWTVLTVVLDMLTNGSSRGVAAHA